MQPTDFSEFTAILDGTCSLLSRGAYAPNATNSALFFKALAAYPMPAVRKGLEGHIADPQRGRFVPTPADVIAQIQGNTGSDGRPGPEEAWAIALHGADEAATIVWTSEMAEAWGIAKSVLDLGDEVGARMAFREAYEARTVAARRSGVPVQWSASLGHDPVRREDALKAADALGRISHREQLALPPAAPVLLLSTSVRGRLSKAKADAIARLKAIGNQAAEPLAWADELRARAKAGESLSEGQRQALAFMDQTAAKPQAALGEFTMIPASVLPPGMRPARARTGDV